MRIYILIKRYPRETNHNYENITTALFCNQNYPNINTTESRLKEFLTLEIIIILRRGR